MNYSSKQENLLKPIDKKFEPTTNWIKSDSPHLRLIRSETPKNSGLIPAEIQRLVEELVEKIEEIQRVIAIATSFPDIHWLDFKIKLKEDAEISDEIWEKIQDIVIDCEWKLRGDYAEKWYFSPEIVDKFYLLSDKKIADSDTKQHTEIKIRSSNSLNFTILPLWK